jgi:glyoxylase I family protein
VKTFAAELRPRRGRRHNSLGDHAPIGYAAACITDEPLADAGGESGTDRRRQARGRSLETHRHPGQLSQNPQLIVLNGSPRLATVRPVPIKLENVAIAVRDLEATIAFFTDLGLTVLGRDTVSGEWTDTAVGLDGNHAKIAMLQTPDGNGRLELFEYIHPDAIETEPTRPNEIGMHRVAFSVDNLDEALEIAAKHGCRPLRGVATYGDVYKLTYVRGPSGIIVMLAEELNRN